ncbi:P-loop NTPase family protein [Aromatoleum toluclasticum]|uniref:hypothetical protein n=1 Tax=Aromatoleum toluclasticum TaxID=92003 RepID=UPI0003769798|nr:hypothetical protein [Aromatoleum toluclasticum]
MSIIIHGPQGCGKSRNAEALRRHFKMERVVDDAECAYPRTTDLPRFEAGRTLYLTNQEPPEHLRSARRVVSYEAAIAQIRDGR